MLVDDLKILGFRREYYQKRNPREGRNEQQAEVEDDIMLNAHLPTGSRQLAISPTAD